MICYRYLCKNQYAGATSLKNIACRNVDAGATLKFACKNVQAGSTQLKTLFMLEIGWKCSIVLSFKGKYVKRVEIQLL